MTHDANAHQPDPTPEQLSAFVDGELDLHRAEEVETWLIDHPEARADVAAYRHLGQVWKQTAAPEPSPAAWDATLARLQAALPAPVVPAPLPRRWGLRSVAWLAATAAVVAGVLLSRPYWNNLGLTADQEQTWPIDDALKALAESHSNIEQVDEPFLVAKQHEVQIISMDGQDADALVGAMPPVHGELDLAGHNDITLLGQLLPDIQLEGWASPMVYPLAMVSGRDK